MAKSSRPVESVAPPEMPNVVPPDIGISGQTRLLVDAVKQSIAEVSRTHDETRADVKEIKDNRHKDFLWTIGTIGTGAVVMLTISWSIYARLDDRIQILSTTLTRVETKLDLVMQRMLQQDAASAAQNAQKKQ